MTRALLPLLPAFARTYHLTPTDIDAMPLRVLSEFTTDYQRLQADQAEGG